MGESSRGLKFMCSFIIPSSCTTGSESNNMMCQRQANRDKKPEIVLASLRGFAKWHDRWS